jgi:predicted kinase
VQPRLIHLNGPPGIGKSTVARLYVQDHPLSFCLDLDGFRRLIGRWDDNEAESGRLARLMALEMARTHLTGGHDVVVPQMVLRIEFIEQMESVARTCSASFHEVVLWADEGDAEARFEERVTDSELTTHHREAARMIDRVGGFARVHTEFQEAMPTLPGAMVLSTAGQDLLATYRDLVTALGDGVSAGSAT